MSRANVSLLMASLPKENVKREDVKGRRRRATTCGNWGGKPPPAGRAQHVRARPAPLNPQVQWNRRESNPHFPGANRVSSR